MNGTRHFLSFPTMAVVVLWALGCPKPSHFDTGDSGRDLTGDDGLPDLAVTQAANDRDYFWFARESIEAAQERVHVVEYLLYDDGLAGELLGELVDASDRGVEVKVLADEANDETEDMLDWLRSQSDDAIQAKLDSGSTTTHNKLIIADDVSLVGSHNLSSSALAENHEASIYVAEAEVTGFYEDYFQALWVNSDADPSLEKPDNSTVVPIKNKEIAAYLESCLDGAQERVRLIMYAMVTYEDSSSDVYVLTRALLAAHERGLDVKVVLDQSDWITDNDINDQAIATFESRNVPLRLAERDTTTHAKVLLCDDTVIVGDANWSYSSMELYNGTSVLVSRTAVVDQYWEWFDEIWAEGEEP